MKNILCNLNYPLIEDNIINLRDICFYEEEDNKYLSFEIKEKEGISLNAVKFSISPYNFSEEALEVITLTLDEKKLSSKVIKIKLPKDTEYGDISIDAVVDKELNSYSGNKYSFATLSRMALEISEAHNKPRHLSDNKVDTKPTTNKVKIIIAIILMVLALAVVVTFLLFNMGALIR